MRRVVRKNIVDPTTESISTPQTTNAIQPTNNAPLTFVLIILLLVASYLLGVLTTKVQYLEKGSKQNAALGQQAATPTNMPTNEQGNKPTGKMKAITEKDHIRGNKDSGITLVEYSDLECPFCKKFHETMKDLLSQYGDKVKFVFRHYPLSFHQNAQKQAEAAECIAELGGNEKFWQFTDTLFERTASGGTGFALDKLGALAAEIGVDETAFQSCLDLGKYEKIVQESLAEGAQAGVSGTPSVFIIDDKGKQQLIVGAQSIDAFKTALDQVIGKN